MVHLPTPRWVPFIIASRIHLVERSWFFVIMLEANDAGSGPIHLLATKKKKYGKIRIIIDLCHEMNRRSFPYDHHR